MWISNCFSVAEGEEESSFLSVKGALKISRGDLQGHEEEGKCIELTFFFITKCFPSSTCEKMGDCVSYALHEMPHTG